MQRNERNVCECFFKAEVKGEIHASKGKVLKNEGGMYELTGIPVGGPYTFTLSDDESKLVFSDVYVDDLWFLGRQSNMQGFGKMRTPQLAYDKAPIEDIRAYYMNESWGGGEIAASSALGKCG